jgi:hypothetical protein
MCVGKDSYYVASPKGSVCVLLLSEEAVVAVFDFFAIKAGWRRKLPK